MKKKQSLIGFTLIEILVVSTIIGLLMAGGIASYSQFGKQSRDARRKADLEQIRAALEMYRSNSVTSSYPDNPTSDPTSDLVPTYLKSYPTDPKTQVKYTYTKLPAGCDESTISPCTDYLLETTLETGGVYQTNPYGGSVITGTSVPQPTATDIPLPACTCDESVVMLDNCTPPLVATCTAKYSCECQQPAATSTPTATPAATSTPVPIDCVNNGGQCVDTGTCVPGGGTVKSYSCPVGMQCCFGLPPPQCMCDDSFVTLDNCTPPSVATCTAKYTCECQSDEY